MERKNAISTCKKALYTIASLALLSSCSDTDEKQLGIWDDNIKLSTKNVTLSASLDSVTITTGGSWWWIDAIEFEDSVYSYYDRPDVVDATTYKITEEGFIVERRDAHTLFVKMKENTSESDRSLLIYLEAGDYFDQLTIQQSAPK